MAGLEQQVQAGSAHTERVRLQVVALGPTADSRHAEVTTRISELGEMTERVLGRTNDSQPPLQPQADARPLCSEARERR